MKFLRDQHNDPIGRLGWILNQQIFFLASGIEQGGSETTGATQSSLGLGQTKCSSATNSSISTILAEPTLLGLLLNRPRVRDEKKCVLNFWSCKKKTLV